MILEPQSFLQRINHLFKTTLDKILHISCVEGLNPMLHERCGKNGVMGPLIGEISLFELGYDRTPALHDITAVKESRPLPQQFNMRSGLYGIQRQPENPRVA